MLHAQAADNRPRFLSSHQAIDQSIAMIVLRRNVVTDAVATALVVTDKCLTLPVLHVDKQRKSHSVQQKDALCTA